MSTCFDLVASANYLPTPFSQNAMQGRDKVQSPSASANLKYCVLFWAFHYNMLRCWSMYREGQLSCGDLEHQSYGQWLRELGLFSLQKRSLRVKLIVYNT